MILRGMTKALPEKHPYSPSTSFSTTVPPDTLNPPSDPTSFTHAQKHQVWRTAMAAEYTALIKNGT